MLLHSWLPQCLRDAGIKVVETSGWTSRSHGQLPENVKVVWHHDASPAGDSPGALNWMISNYPSSSANIWVDNYGTWHLVGTGVSWHAGRVLPGMPDNFSSIGIETDQTIGEAWPPAQLDSLRKGTAAIFKKQQVPTSWLHFHKTICSPVGRKSDPAGLDLPSERNQVAKIMAGNASAPPAAAAAPKPEPEPTPPPKEWDEMATKEEIAAVVDARLKEWLPRMLNVYMNGQGNSLFPKGSTIAIDGMGIIGRMQRGVDASRTGNPNSAFPAPAKPKD
jgi:hypothetical protein